MNKLFAAWRTFQERFLQYVAGALLLGLTLLAILEVVRRYGFGVSFYWQQDAVTFGILSGVFLFFAITQSRRAHLRVTLILLLMREKGGRWGGIVAGVFEILGALLGIAFCSWLVWRGIDVARLMIAQDRKTESLLFPLWPFFAVFLTGMAFLAISFVFQLYQDVQALRGKKGLVDKYGAGEESGPIL